MSKTLEQKVRSPTGRHRSSFPKVKKRFEQSGESRIYTCWKPRVKRLDIVMLTSSGDVFPSTIIRLPGGVSRFEL